MAFFGAATGSTVAATTEKDIELADPPTDSISSLAWSPAAEYLAAGSWDGQARYIPMCGTTEELTFLACVRLGYGKWVRKDSLRARRCTRTKRLSLVSAGTRCVRVTLIGGNDILILPFCETGG
jgi:hypothetical protein